MEGQGGGEAQGVADPQKNPDDITFYFQLFEVRMYIKIIVINTTKLKYLLT
jgi:hypothetical protein